MAFILFDEHLGQCHPVGEVRFSRPKTTVRDLIRARVELEYERHRDELALGTGDQKGLLPPSPAEAALNGKDGARGFGWAFLRYGGTLDGLVKEAEQAFLGGRYYVLLDDRQAEHLDDAVDLDSTANATFLLLTPLQGG